jgi:flagellar biosynthesis/type III secretory pathway protein FliH
MPSWPDTLRLSQPLRGVKLTAPTWSAELEIRIQERERAATERGRAEAQKLFGEQVIRQRTELLALQDGILGALKDAIPGVVRDCENHLATLALEVARKLVDDLPVTAEMVNASISAAMRQVEESAHYSIFVNPEDLKLLQSTTSSILGVNDSRQIKVTASAEVTRGGCIVETPFGRVDARRETKYDLLKGAILS